MELIGYIGHIFWVIFLIGAVAIAWGLSIQILFGGVGLVLTVVGVLVYHWRWTLPVLLVAGLFWYARPTPQAKPTPVPSGYRVPA